MKNKKIIILILITIFVVFGYQFFLKNKIEDLFFDKKIKMQKEISSLKEQYYSLDGLLLTGEINKKEAENKTEDLEKKLELFISNYELGERIERYKNARNNFLFYENKTLDLNFKIMALKEILSLDDLVVIEEKFNNIVNYSWTKTESTEEIESMITSLEEEIYSLVKNKEIFNQFNNRINIMEIHKNTREKRWSFKNNMMVAGELLPLDKDLIIIEEKFNNTVGYSWTKAKNTEEIELMITSLEEEIRALIKKKGLTDEFNNRMNIIKIYQDFSERLTVLGELLADVEDAINEF